MKIRNLEELEEHLDLTLAWRKKELYILSSSMLQVDETGQSIENISIIRAGYLFLYAHWEGYIRDASNYYLVYLSNKNIKNKFLKHSFNYLYVKNNLKNTLDSKKNFPFIKFMNIVDDSYNKPFFVKYTNDNRQVPITTDSNLNYEKLTDILTSLSLKNNYELIQNFLDHDLLSIRNSIAHGEDQEVSYAEFIETRDKIFDIIDEFTTQLITSAENECYLK